MIDSLEGVLAWDLTRGMSRAIGVNLPRAVIDGWFSRKELAVLVTRCQACGRTECCLPWLAVTAHATALPEFCPNKADLDALRAAP